MNEFVPSGITEVTPENTLFGAGIVCKGLFYGEHYSPTNDLTPQDGKIYYTPQTNSSGSQMVKFSGSEFMLNVKYYEKYTGWNAAQTVIGATSGGTKLTITPEFSDIEADGATVKVKGLAVKTGETATLETNLLEVTKDIIKEAIVGTMAEVSTSPATYSEIVSTPRVSKNDYIENLGFVGTRLDGKKVIVIFENALCTSGFDLEFKNKETSVLKAKFECYADLTDDPTKLPYHVYVQN